VNPFWLVLLFIISALAGYKLISAVPSLLHTPLMSGMNALSGITVLGAVVATGLAVSTGSIVFGCMAVVMSMINVVGGFGVTGRMLAMFKHKEEDR
jgi:NAD(P) transhydrogenase subunit alpha